MKRLKVAMWAALAAASGVVMGIQLGFASPSEHGGRAVVVYASLANLSWLLLAIWSRMVKDSSFLFLFVFLVIMNGVVLGAGAVWTTGIQSPYGPNMILFVTAAMSLAAGVTATKTVTEAELASPEQERGRS